MSCADFIAPWTQWKGFHWSTSATLLPYSSWLPPSVAESFIDTGKRKLCPKYVEDENACRCLSSMVPEGLWSQEFYCCTHWRSLWLWCSPNSSRASWYPRGEPDQFQTGTSAGEATTQSAMFSTLEISILEMLLLWICPFSADLRSSTSSLQTWFHLVYSILLHLWFRIYGSTQRCILSSKWIVICIYYVYCINLSILIFVQSFIPPFLSCIH